jgi:hypothetical protein
VVETIMFETMFYAAVVIGLFIFTLAAVVVVTELIDRWRL